MSDTQNPKQNADASSNAVKDPENWTTGDEPMTGAQRSYLQTLAEEAGVEVDNDLTKAEASERIDELQQKTGRGTDEG
jgi:hypothetical protein